MAYIPNQAQNTGVFIPTTQVYDIKVGDVDVNSEQFRQLFVKLHQTVNQIANALNLKESGYYMNDEFLTSSLVFNPANLNPLQMRPVYRKTFATGALNAGPTPVPHGLTIGATWSFLKIFGAASVAGTYYPLPFSSAGGAANIEVAVGAANIVITNNSGVAFTSGFIILEYIKF